MGNRIVISESQYSRLFLNEQYDKPKGWAKWNPHIRMWTHPAYSNYEVNVPKNFIFKKNDDGTFTNKYPSSTGFGVDSDVISKDDPDIIQQTISLENEKLFNKHIKNIESGNKFRNWVNDSPKVLKLVNSEIKRIADSNSDFNYSGLERSGDFNNKYIKIAFDKVGRQYINREKMNPYIDWKDGGNPSFAGFPTDIKSDWEYLTYKEALSNWGKVKTFFGWTDDKSIGSENISKILNQNVPKSTCIDPTYILKEKYKLVGELNIIKNVSEILTARDFERGGELTNYFGDPKETEEIKDLESVFAKNRENDSKEKELKYNNQQPTIPFNVADNTSIIKPNIPLINTEPLNYNKNMGVLSDYKKKLLISNNLEDVLRDYGVDKSDFDDVKEKFSLLNKYNFVLKKVHMHNLIISLQSKDLYENACDDCDKCYGPNVVITQKRKYVHAIPSDSSTYDTKYFFRSDMCKNKGGIFLIPTQPTITTKGIESNGFNNDSASCCCANPKGTSKVNMYVHQERNVRYPLKLYGGDKEYANYTLDVSVEDYCNDSIGDIRDGWKKFGDWGENCVNDWHCIFDIASIGVLAFGPMGMILSGVIDAISAIGYVVEGDENWQMNAGLTALGVFGVGGEALSLAGKGSKLGGKISELNKIIKKGENLGDPFKLEKEITKWTKSLNKTEKVQYESFISVAEDLSTTKGKNLLKQLKNQTEKLTKTEKGVLAKILKNEGADKIKKLYKTSGNDIKKMVNSYFKGVKQVIIQGSLFGGMYVYSKEIGEWLKGIYDKYGFDPLGIFNESGEISVPNPASNVDWSVLMKDDPEYFKKIDSELEKISTSFGGGNEYDFGGYINSQVKSDNAISNLKTEWQKPLNKKLESLDKEIHNSIDGSGFETLNDKLSIGIDIYNKIQNLKGGETLEDIKKIIDKGISDVKNISTKKLSNKEKTAIITTNNLEVDPEMVDFIDNLFNDTENDMENNSKEDTKGIVPLKEEINRIKSLFSEERLYGNLINEQPYATDTDGDGNISEPEAVKFLQSLEYVVKANSEEDMCLGPNTKLKKVYDKLKSKSNIGFQLKNTSIGCGLSIYSKRNSPRVAQLDLFEGNTGNRFGMLITVDVSECCDKPLKDFGGDLSAAPNSIKWNAGQKGWDSGTQRFGIGLKRIKIDGTWGIDGAGDIYIKDGVIMKLLNENYKGVPTKIKFSVGSFNPNSKIPGFTNTGTDRGGNKTWMQDSSGVCVTLDTYCGVLMGGSISDKFNLESIVNIM